MLEQPELPPAKGIWALNTDRLLKVCTQLEQTGEYTPQEEQEQTEFDQTNIRVGLQGVILDENGHFDLQEAFSNLRMATTIIADEDKTETADDDDDDDDEGDSVIITENQPKAPVGWTDEDITSTIASAYQETASSTTHILPINFRKRSHFNGRPYASWGNLFPPLYASALFPLPPATEKFWWQIARDLVPADANATGIPNNNFSAKIKKFMAPKFNCQVWNDTVMENISGRRTSTMIPPEISTMRSKLQSGYIEKFPKSSAMFDHRFFTQRNGEMIPRSNFNEQNHEKYGSRKPPTRSK